MLFEFLNTEATAKALIETSSTFSSKYSQQQAIAFLEQQAVDLFKKYHAGATQAGDVDNSKLCNPVWKDVGATFTAVGSPNPPRGNDFPVSFDIPGAIYIELRSISGLH
jgi:hypothetical protein